MKKSIGLSCMFFVFVLALSAQEISPQVLSNAGESYEGQNIQLDWTLGELAVSTLTTPNQQVTQGFHQTYYTISSLSELPADFGKIAVFPNPTTDWINLDMSFDEIQKVQTSLFDVDGKLIWTKEVSGQVFSEKYSFATLPAGSYFLHFLFNGKSYSKAFQINKM